MALPSYDEGLQLVVEPLACFSTRTYRQHMTILPKYIGQLKKGVTDILDSQVKTYVPQLEGVLIAYKNPRRFQSGGRIFEELPHLHVDIEVDVIIFKPQIGCSLEGFVNKISRDHIGCLVHRCFNASVSRPAHLTHGEWEGSKLALGEEFEFTVTKIVDHSGQIFMRGKIVQGSLPDPDKRRKESKRKLPEIGDNNESTSLEPAAKKHKKKKKSKETEPSTPPRSKQGAHLTLNSTIDHTPEGYSRRSPTSQGPRDHTPEGYSKRSPTSLGPMSYLDTHTPDLLTSPPGLGHCLSSDSGVSSNIGITEVIKSHKKKSKKNKKDLVDADEEVSTPTKHKHKHKVREKMFH